MSHYPGYAEENQIIQLLERRVITSSRKKSFDPHSLRGLLRVYLRDNARSLSLLHSALFSWRRNPFAGLTRLRNSQPNRTVLVVGNGPSQSTMSSEDLAAFRARGGHIFVVNTFYNSDALVEVGPTAVVWSDGLTIPRLLSDDTGLERFKRSLGSSAPLIFVPHRSVAEVGHLGVDCSVVPFCDMEIRYRGLKESRSTRPDRPRSYVSMTLFKALAIAQWIGYKNILVVGMDNTYPRDLYCSASNHVLLRERHAFESDYMNDLSQQFRSVGDFLYEISLLMLDLSKFADDRVLNLDPYSLTDTFKKAQSVEHAGQLLRGEAAS